MTFYIALIALAFAGFVIHEFTVNRDLRAAAPAREKGSRRRRFARLKSRFEPIAAGTRLPTSTPASAHPLGLSRNLGSHA